MTQTGEANRRNITWGLLLVGLLGVVIGLGAFTFSHARGTSYFSDNPESCVNCHVMRDQFEGWNHSSHARVATCNDCHTPHTSEVAKWAGKAINGFNHSVAFTFGNFDDPIHIRDWNADITRANCIGCHQDMVTMINGPIHDEQLDCIACHADVGHRTRD